VNIGIGSPTGIKFGTDSKFPRKYQDALFAMDWSYGRILAVHLKAVGASYTGTFENFVAPKSLRSTGPKATLNVTDLEFAQDGAMYFTTGGRGTQSGLYRVSYVGKDYQPFGRMDPIVLAAGQQFPGTETRQARNLRQELEL